MSKIYGLVLGALLIAGEALGITVQEAMSLGFRYDRPSYDVYKHDFADYYHARYKKSKTSSTTEPDGSVRYSDMYMISCPKVWQVRWKSKEYTEGHQKGIEYCILDKQQQLTAWRGRLYKDKIETKIHEEQEGLLAGRATQEDLYKVKPLKKQAHPMGPFTVNDWFPDAIKTNSFYAGDFYGTEQTSVTNIISDNEAYITRTIQQTGHIHEYLGHKVDEDSFLQRVYDTHITTDADHVYVSQNISETTTNAQASIIQKNWQTEYTATFKKGRWKESVETVSSTETRHACKWYEEYLKSVGMLDSVAVVSAAQGLSTNRVKSAHSSQKVRE